MEDPAPEIATLRHLAPAFMWALRLVSQGRSYLRVYLQDSATFRHFYVAFREFLSIFCNKTGTIR